MKTVNIDEQQIKIFGRGGNHKDVSLTMSLREIKHIRRCIETYSYIHPQLPTYAYDNLSEIIYGKLKEFGRICMRGKLKIKFKKDEMICSEENCSERKELTIHHKTTPLCGGSGKSNLKLMCPKHHLLCELNSILANKSLEIEELKNKIDKTNRNENPEVLGYHTIKNRLRYIEDSKESK